MSAMRGRVGGGGGKRTIREKDLELEETALPQSLVLAWYAAFPLLQIECALGCLCGLCDKPKRMVLPPLLSERS